MSALADYEAQVAALLNDASYATWTAAQLDKAIKLALHEFSRFLPQLKHKSVTLTASAYIYDITAAPFSISDCLYIQEIAYPYGASDYPYSPLIAFHQRENNIFLEAEEGESGEIMLVKYAAPHTIDDLDGATATTIPDSWLPLLCTGAAAYAAFAKANQTAREYNWPETAAKNMLNWAKTLLDEFHQGLSNVPPATAWASWGSSPLPPTL